MVRLGLSMKCIFAFQFKKIFSNETVWDVAKYRTRPMVKKLMDSIQRDEVEVVRRKLSKLAQESKWQELTSEITSLRRENKIETSLQPPDGDGRTSLWVRVLNFQLFQLL